MTQKIEVEEMLKNAGYTVRMPRCVMAKVREVYALYGCSTASEFVKRAITEKLEKRGMYDRNDAINKDIAGAYLTPAGYPPTPKLTKQL